ncbi:oocyte zinc finger protein XlCOF19-like [Armigeres subalbatus]|uniref:oocyte zinc finger protein XlCOF19-like n=1 Tax=Armigeres subalbatus TaxID=124917 RepID=UPI002ED1F397
MIPQVESGSSCDKYSSREEGDELSTEDTQSTKFAPPTCHLCSQLFTSRQTLYVHVREQHSGDRRLHKCGVCQATFKRKGHLEDHMSSHTGECRYSCKHCEAKFTRPKTLMRHRKSCSKEHPLNTQPLKRQSPLTEGQFQCEFCPKSFKHRPSLNFHIKSHYELLPYGCELCDARFVNDKGLLIHRGKYHANVPNEGTPARKTSPAPMQPKTGVQCAYCPRRFKEQRYLTQHIKFIHTAKSDDVDDQEKGDSSMAEGCASEQDQDDDNMEAVTIKFEVEENDSNFEEIMY